MTSEFSVEHSERTETFIRFYHNFTCFVLLYLDMPAVMERPLDFRLHLSPQDARHGCTSYSALHHSQMKTRIGSPKVAVTCAENSKNPK